MILLLINNLVKYVSLLKPPFLYKLTCFLFNCNSLVKKRKQKIVDN